MTLYKYGFCFNNRSSKLNITEGLYPVFDSIFQQMRQIVLSPEAKFPLKTINDLTFTLDCYKTDFSKNLLTLKITNKHDLNFHISSHLFYVAKTNKIYVVDAGLSAYDLDQYFSGEVYKSNKIYINPQFYNNIIQTLNYVKNATHVGNPNDPRLVHITNIIEEYRQHLYNWLKLIKDMEYRKTHPSVITYQQIKNHDERNIDLLYKAYLQAICDAWKNYAFKAHLTDSQIASPDFIHVKHFKHNQAQTGNYALIRFLPDSVKEWRKIITYAKQQN